MTTPKCTSGRTAHLSELQRVACSNDAMVRVELFEYDSSSHEEDLCEEHAHEAAGEYPDNIKLVKSY